MNDSFAAFNGSSIDTSTASDIPTAEPQVPAPLAIPQASAPLASSRL